MRGQDPRPRPVLDTSRYTKKRRGDPGQCRFSNMFVSRHGVACSCWGSLWLVNWALLHRRMGSVAHGDGR